MNTPIVRNWDLQKWIKEAAPQLPKYFYVPCEDASQKCKPEFRHYFRLYRNTSEGPVLVEQSTSSEGWEENYKAKIIVDEALKPYPNLD